MGSISGFILITMGFDAPSGKNSLIISILSLKSKAAKSISVPSLNSTITMEEPSDDWELTLFILLTVDTALSIGLVTKFSTS